MAVKKLSLKDGTLGGTILYSTALSLLPRKIPPCVKLYTYLVSVLVSLHLLPCLLTYLLWQQARHSPSVWGECNYARAHNSLQFADWRSRGTWTIGHLSNMDLSVTIYRMLPFVFHTPSNLWTQKQQILQIASKVAIACSYRIFNSRNSASWDANEPLFRLTITQTIFYYYYYYYFSTCLLPCQVSEVN